MPKAEISGSTCAGCNSRETPIAVRHCGDRGQHSAHASYGGECVESILIARRLLLNNVVFSTEFRFCWSLTAIIVVYIGRRADGSDLCGVRLTNLARMRWTTAGRHVTPTSRCPP